MITQETFTEIPNGHLVFACQHPFPICQHKSPPFPLRNYPFSNLSANVMKVRGQLIPPPVSRHSHVTQAEHMTQNSPIKPIIISPKAFPESTERRKLFLYNQKTYFRELSPESKAKTKESRRTNS